MYYGCIKDVLKMIICHRKYKQYFLKIYSATLDTCNTSLLYLLSSIYKKQYSLYTHYYYYGTITRQAVYTLWGFQRAVL